MLKKAYRMGIDVGGTHTKAIALDNQTHEIVAKASVKTTHDHPDGVAAGVVASFEKCLKVGNISPDDVVFIAHSTTQATNALLEGDVASVGVLGMGKGFFENIMAKKQTNIGDVTLTTGKKIHVVSDYQKVPLTKERVAQSIDGLLSQGAGVIVASKAFGVDDMQEELLVRSACMERGIPCSMASDITKLYGLTIRTRTAAINASILPKMLSTANSTEQSVRNAGIKVPLMIMRGDAGVMDIDEMRKRPVLTMLSGPAASVVGALMYLRASNGIYFEVGGTSVNIGVIKNGRLWIMPLWEATAPTSTLWMYGCWASPAGAWCARPTERLWTSGLGAPISPAVSTPHSRRRKKLRIPNWFLSPPSRRSRRLCGHRVEKRQAHRHHQHLRCQYPGAGGREVLCPRQPGVLHESIRPLAEYLGLSEEETAGRF